MSHDAQLLAELCLRPGDLLVSTRSSRDPLPVLTIVCGDTFPTSLICVSSNSRVAKLKHCHLALSTVHSAHGACWPRLTSRSPSLWHVKSFCYGKSAKKNPAARQDPLPLLSRVGTSVPRIPKEMGRGYSSIRFGIAVQNCCLLASVLVIRG